MCKSDKGEKGQNFILTLLTELCIPKRRVPNIKVISILVKGDFETKYRLSSKFSKETPKRQTK